MNSSSAILQKLEKESFWRIKIDPTIRELISQFIISSNGTLKNNILYKGKY